MMDKEMNEKMELACLRAASKIANGKTGFEELDSTTDFGRAGLAGVARTIASELRIIMEGK